MQGAFIDALVYPVFKFLAELLPLVDDFCLKTLQSNRAFWNSLQNQDLLTTSKIVAYLNEMQDSTKEYPDTDDSEENVISTSDVLESPIPGIPANAPMGLSHSKRQMSLISMKGRINMDDPELGEVLPPPDIRENHSEQKKKLYERVHMKLQIFLEHNISQAVLLLATIYALFANDINIAAGSKDADSTVNAFSLFVLLIFVFEIILSIICVPKYYHFFLWLDLAASISLLFEIDVVFEFGDSPGDLSLAKASRAAKAGARAGR